MTDAPASTPTPALARTDLPSLVIVVPCYNEEAVLPETSRRLGDLLDTMHRDDLVAGGSHVLYVDDCSTDRTWALIQEACAGGRAFRGLKLSRNVGHQRALLAGLMNAEAELAISVDADLQDDLEVMFDMVRLARAGSDIVFGVRRKRAADTLFKRFTAEGYYKLLEVFGVDIVFNHADYRLMSRKAIEALRSYRESNLFLRGLVTHIGFTSSRVYYDRRERFAGESKYPVSKMLALAWDGITSFSSAPLRAITVSGLVIALGSIALSGWAIWVKLFTSLTIPGWASSVVPIYFLGGVQLMGMGVIGEYIAKIYLETKQRPHYHIDVRTPPAGGGSPSA